MTTKPTSPVEQEIYPPPPMGTVTNPPTTVPDQDKVFEGIPVVMGAPAVSTAPPQQLGTLETGQAHDQYSSHWSTGLCDCFSDMHSCCLVCWCPCIAFGRIAEIVDKGTSSCCQCGSLYLLLLCLGAATGYAASALGSTSVGGASFQWILSCVYRGKLKQSLNMRPSGWEDCCTHFWCEPCAICQEYRELQSRGYDLSLGWEGNMKKQSATSTEPPVPVSMDC